MRAISTVVATQFILIIFVLLSSNLNDTSAMNCNKNDYKALLNIKQSLGNPIELSKWQPNTNCCNWDNLYCTEDGRVYNIYFYTFNIKANIPSAFGDLSSLQSLALEDMPGLTGSIPQSFAKLSQLYLLEITNTSLSGTIPDFLTGTNLSALILSHNKLSGPIPRSLSNAPFLRYVDLSYNQLSGSIPPGLLHWDYQFLILSNNQLSGQIPNSYGQGDLQTIDLSHNKLTGDPSVLFSIDKPTNKIDLSWNQFEFDMTKTAFPAKLTYLDLSHNKIRGAVTKSLKDLYLLLDLNLTYNLLCGEIPTGRAMVYHDASSYLHNKCLCGTPLPPCSKRN